ncbi:purine-nucleoside phosphorylase [Lutispora thermophila]|uniref:Purine nucleoside phosphorylase n=1 Tax=Lutispora thermophila DSM 19022 TaxID=1122184 RepID=A0A1M6F6J0_9FIRM|nr:purine-nucleoside phosphorylase [Lutispora thermophila]SHI93344.1 purine-nucleoside phosphorylase [Lutispora thermophila DSM 19022]
MSYINRIERAYEYINNLIPCKPDIGIVLGSGLGTLADYIENRVIIDYNNIPDFPISTVEGHEGRFIFGDLEGKKVLAMQGRFHYYEGYSMKDITLPIRIMKKLGIGILILSNACGALNKSFKPGDLMIIKDHINLLGDNPLIGENLSEFGPRFPDMSQTYDANLIKVCKSAAEKLGITLQEGVYTAVSGPNYETKAELNMLIVIGSDAVGMSTVPEAIVAKHCNMKILGLSCITDMALPDELVPLTHEEVVRVAELAKPRFVSLVKEFIKEVTPSESL